MTPYSAFPNHFRTDLRAGRRLIGCWCSLANPISTEILGLAGFDWLLLDTEHSLNDAITLVPQLMALKDSGAAPMVRPAWNDAVLIKRLLDAGFYNFLVPFVQSADEAARAVAATRYPPRGVRGVSTSQRGNRFGTVPDFFETVDDNICVTIQIESRAGVDAVDAICAVPDVDGIFVGPADLAAALGHLGNPSHPEVQEAMKHIYAAAQRQQRAIGTLAPAEADAHRYLGWGASFVAVGSDQGLLRSASAALREKFRA
jgi:2-dehydro-3-deoxyglucarate aldolase